MTFCSLEQLKYRLKPIKTKEHTTDWHCRLEKYHIKKSSSISDYWIFNLICCWKVVYSQLVYDYLFNKIMKNYIYIKLNTDVLW